MRFRALEKAPIGPYVYLHEPWTKFPLDNAIVPVLFLVARNKIVLQTRWFHPCIEELQGFLSPDRSWSSCNSRVHFLRFTYLAPKIWSNGGGNNSSPPPSEKHPAVTDTCHLSPVPQSRIRLVCRITWTSPPPYMSTDDGSSSRCGAAGGLCIKVFRFSSIKIP